MFFSLSTLVGNTLIPEQMDDGFEWGPFWRFVLGVAASLSALLYLKVRYKVRYFPLTNSKEITFQKSQYTTLINYKFRGRRPSIARLANPDLKTESEFTYSKNIAITAANTVRLFSNATNEAIVIKSPNEKLKQSAFKTVAEFEEQRDSIWQAMLDELSFNKQAYPNEALYELETATYTSLGGAEWTYRLILPLITWQTFEEYVSMPHRNTTTLLFLIAIARELQRIHQANIIHGDVKENNGFVRLNATKDDFEVQFIDFGYSYAITDRKARSTSDNGPETLYFAPERRIKAGGKVPAPNVKQDVYSYGYMALKFINRKPGLQSTYPSLFSIMSQTQSPNPAERPDLEEIISDATRLMR